MGPLGIEAVSPLSQLPVELADGFIGIWQMSFGLVRLIGESVDRSRWIGIFSISETVLLDAPMRPGSRHLKPPARSDGRRPAGARRAFFFDLSTGAGLANEGEVKLHNTLVCFDRSTHHIPLPKDRPIPLLSSESSFPSSFSAKFPSRANAHIS